MIHIYCDGGLGNRLLSMFSAMYFAKKANGTFIIHWPANNWCGCNFTDIFSNNYNVTNFNIQFLDTNILNKCVLLIHESQINHRAENKIIINGTLSQEDIVRLMAEESDAFYYGNCLHHSIDPNKLIDIINGLALSEQVFVKTAEYNVSDCIGIHIRRTDYGKKPYLDDNQLENEVRANIDRKYFLCSDEKDVEMKFKKYDNVLLFEKKNYVEKFNAKAKWKSYIVDTDGRSFPFNVNRSKTSSIEAFCDMVLLSRTATRLNTSGSSFLKCADLMSKTNISKCR